VPRPEGAVLIPVPLGSRRYQERGYNQAEVLARAIGDLWGLPVDSDALCRARETASQTAFDPVARRRNVHGAFRAVRAGRAAGPVRDAVLIDDVLTTGATLLAAGAALKQSGWQSVGALTFARALDAGGRILASR
jgi:ComF family protein